MIACAGQGLCGLEIAGLKGHNVELFEGDAGLEVLFGLIERLQLLIGRHHILAGVALARPALGVDDLGGEQARAVVVEKRRQPVAVERVHG